jgi:enoyl-CoA hydratase/carnithine racemase
MGNRVIFEIKNEIAYVTMNRPDKFNAVDWDMIEALLNTAKKIKQDKSIRAVILSGNGKAFCSGLDFPSFGKQKKNALLGFISWPWKNTNKFQEVAWCWRKLPIPVISVLHGYCFGAGVQIALACDFRFITPDCQFSILEAKWGLIPDMSGTVTLRELLPIDKAKMLTMTGRMITGTEAHQYNLVTDVGANPMAMAEALAEEIKERSPDSVSATKKLFQETWGTTENIAFSKERMIQFGLMRGKNQKIQLQANFKKEKPNFLNRK